jgi:hypothetical protein
LYAVRPIVDPPATRLDELASADRRRMTDNGDQIALAARLHPQHAEAVILVVEGHPLDEAGQVLACRLSGRCWSDHNQDARQQARRTSSAAASPCIPECGSFHLWGKILRSPKPRKFDLSGSILGTMPDAEDKDLVAGYAIDDHIRAHDD